MIELGKLNVGDKFYLPHSPKTILRVIYKDEECKISHYTFDDIGTYMFNLPYDEKVNGIK